MHVRLATHLRLDKCAEFMFCVVSKIIRRKPCICRSRQNVLKYNVPTDDGYTYGRSPLYKTKRGQTDRFLICALSRWGATVGYVSTGAEGDDRKLSETMDIIVTGILVCKPFFSWVYSSYKSTRFVQLSAEPA